MNDLTEKKCVPCEGGLPPLDYKEIHKYLKKVNGWNVKTNEKKNYFIEKEFIFKNFIESQKFVNLVGEISEKEGHHPDIAFGWGYAKIKIFTHSAHTTASLSRSRALQKESLSMLLQNLNPCKQSIHFVKIGVSIAL